MANNYTFYFDNSKKNQESTYVTGTHKTKPVSMTTYKCKEKDLPTYAGENELYFTTDTNCFYVGRGQKEPIARIYDGKSDGNPDEIATAEDAQKIADKFSV